MPPKRAASELGAEKESQLDAYPKRLKQTVDEAQEEIKRVQTLLQAVLPVRWLVLSYAISENESYLLFYLISNLEEIGCLRHLQPEHWRKLLPNGVASRLYRNMLMLKPGGFPKKWIERLLIASHDPEYIPLDCRHDMVLAALNWCCVDNIKLLNKFKVLTPANYWRFIGRACELESKELCVEMEEALKIVREKDHATVREARMLCRSPEMAMWFIERYQVHRTTEPALDSIHTLSLCVTKSQFCELQSKLGASLDWTETEEMYFMQRVRSKDVLEYVLPHMKHKSQADYLQIIRRWLEEEERPSEECEWLIQTSCLTPHDMAGLVRNMSTAQTLRLMQMVNMRELVSAAIRDWPSRWCRVKFLHWFLKEPGFSIKEVVFLYCFAEFRDRNDECKRLIEYAKTAADKFADCKIPYAFMQMLDGTRTRKPIECSDTLKESMRHWLHTYCDEQGWPHILRSAVRADPSGQLLLGRISAQYPNGFLMFDGAPARFTEDNDFQPVQYNEKNTFTAFGMLFAESMDLPGHTLVMKSMCETPHIEEYCSGEGVRSDAARYLLLTGRASLVIQKWPTMRIWSGMETDVPAMYAEPWGIESTQSRNRISPYEVMSNCLKAAKGKDDLKVMVDHLRFLPAEQLRDWPNWFWIDLEPTIHFLKHTPVVPVTVLSIFLINKRSREVCETIYKRLFGDL